MKTPLAGLVGGLLISFAGIFFVLSETSAFTGAFFRAAYAVPALTMVWATAFLGERPSAIQIAGALVVLTGVGVLALSRANPAPITARSELSAQHQDE